MLYNSLSHSISPLYSALDATAASDLSEISIILFRLTQIAMDEDALASDWKTILQLQ